MGRRRGCSNRGAYRCFAVLGAMGGVPMFFVKGKREVFSGLEVTAGARWCCRQDGAAAGSGGVRWCQAAAATGVSWMVGGE